MTQRKVYLSALAAKKLSVVLLYLEEEWSEKVKQEYLEKLKRKLKQIGKNPTAYPLVEGLKDVRKCQVTKLNSLFYRFTDTEVEVITHFDNRQDPNKIWKELGL